MGKTSLLYELTCCLSDHAIGPAKHESLAQESPLKRDYLLPSNESKAD